MTTIEIDELAELIASKVYQKLISGTAILDHLTETIANKVSVKLEASESFDLSNMDANVLAAMVNDLQNKVAQEVVVKQIEL